MDFHHVFNFILIAVPFICIFLIIIYRCPTYFLYHHSIQVDLGCPGGAPLLLLIRNPHTHHHLSY